MRQTFLFHYGMPTRNLSLVILVLGALLLWLPCPSSLSQAQVPPITPSGLNTQVSDPIAVGGQTQYDITGGTRPGGGVNLFHSFGEFGVPQDNIANFLNETALPTSNILGRVTGGNISNIFGAIQTEGFGNANLFLMNPTGFLFGPNATVNVGGMVTFTSADYLRLEEIGGGNAGIFYADPAQLSLLTTAPVAAFGFLGSNPGAITVQGGALRVPITLDPVSGQPNGSTLSLFGGDINIAADPDTGTPASVMAPSGQINLVSVTSPGEILFPSLNTGPNINGQTFTTMGAVNLKGGSVLDVSDSLLEGDGHGGSIRIRGGQFVMDSSMMLANTLGEEDGANPGISIAAQDDIILTNLSGIATQTFGAGRSGDIEINARNVEVRGGSVVLTLGAGEGQTGQAGNISVVASDSVLVTGTDEFGQPSAMLSQTAPLTSESRGDSGSILVRAPSVTLNDGGIIMTSATAIGRAGDISLNVTNLNILGGGEVGTVGAGGDSSSGNVTIRASDTVTISGQLNPDTLSKIRNRVDGLNLGTQGDVSISAREIILADEGQIRSENFGQGGGGSGNVTLAAGESITMTSGARIVTKGNFATVGGINLSAPLITVDQATIFARSVNEFQGGAITLSGNTLTISGASEILSSTEQSTGQGGAITLAASDTVSVSSGSIIGSSTLAAAEGPAGPITITADNLVALSGTGTGLFSESFGSGDGGAITIRSAQVQVSDGAVVSAKSTGSGASGSVTIEGTQSPAQSVLIDGPGSGLFTDTQGTGAGGNIFVNANSVTLQNGGTLSAKTSGTEATATGGTITVDATQVEVNLGEINASTSGPGDAGTIHINATDRIALTNKAIIASSSERLLSDAQGNGGAIVLHAPQINISGDALVSSSTIGPGNAGDVVLETQSLIMSGVRGQGGRIITNTQGPGQGGNITVQGLEGQESAAEVFQLTHGSLLLAQTIGGLTGAEGNAGSIHVQAATLVLDGASQLSTAAQDSAGGAGTVIVDATDSVHLSGRSSITSNSAGASFGPAGDITITSPTIWLKGASFISTSTEFVGNAGNITLHTQALSLTEDSKLTSNSGPQLFPEFLSGSAGSVTIQDQGSPAQSVLVDGSGSGIFTDTQGTGAGGNIFVNANSITLQNGGTLSAETSGTAATAIGGTITVDATNTVTMNSALITAKSAGVADAGSINITSPNGFTMQSSTITTQAGQGAGGGNIKVTTSPAATVLLQDSLISASVADGHGGGGNISIDPQYVILQNSQILAQAAQGQGGAITITAGLFLPDANSKVNADSGSGVNGTVTIQSPNAPASGKIQPLGKTPLQATSLLNQHCAALAGGEFSSFTVAGRDSLPTEPGSWLASPLATLNAGMGLGAKAEGVRPVARGDGLGGETALLSLRQIAPAGFLTQAFVTDSSTGCS